MQKKLLIAFIIPSAFAACFLFAQDPAATPTPAPTPIPVQVQAVSSLILVAADVPVPVVEALRQYVVSCGAFAFPADQAGRPLQSLSISVSGERATARIVLGPVATPTPTPTPEPTPTP